MQLDKPINRVMAIGANNVLTLGLVRLMSDLQSAGNLGMAAILLLGKRTRSSGATTASDLPPGLHISLAANAEALLQPSHEHQDDQNEQYNSQASAWAIAPIAAVAPSGQSAENKKDHEN
jgi:hypothetical protein